MAEVDLDKLSPELRSALERELAPRPQRQDTIGVNFVYDPDSEESVTKGYQRGHLTDVDLEQWGWQDLLTKLRKVAGPGEEGGKEGGEDGERTPARRGYFRAADK